MIRPFRDEPGSLEDLAALEPGAWRAALRDLVTTLLDPKGK
jgi:hypothetical protein